MGTAWKRDCGRDAPPCRWTRRGGNDPGGEGNLRGRGFEQGRASLRSRGRRGAGPASQHRTRQGRRVRTAKEEAESGLAALDPRVTRQQGGGVGRGETSGCVPAFTPGAANPRTNAGGGLELDRSAVAKAAGKVPRFHGPAAQRGGGDAQFRRRNLDLAKQCCSAHGHTVMDIHPSCQWPSELSRFAGLAL